MTESLTRYIFSNRYPQASFEFSRWLTASDRFRVFAENDRNRNKLRAKVNNAKTDEDFKDTWFEFYMAYLLLRNEFFSEVIYEKYETESRAPDFTVICQKGIIFNLEVRRIRKSSQSKLFERFKASLAKQIPKIQTPLAVGIYLQYLDELNPSPDLLVRLHNGIATIIAFIVKTIPEAEESIPFDEVKHYSVPDFDGEVELVFSKPSGKQTSPLSYYGISSHSPFKTYKEHYKFGDIVFEKLGQMRSGEINILAVITDNDTHNEFDFWRSIQSISKLIEITDDKFFQSKGFVDTNDFIEKVALLSGVFFRGPWEILPIEPDTTIERNMLWCNQDAEKQIPDDIRDVFRGMR